MIDEIVTIIKLTKLNIKKKFFLSIYKMLQIRKEEYEKCKIEVIDKGRYFWVNKKELAVKSDVANWAQIFDKCEIISYRQELTPNAKYQ